MTIFFTILTGVFVFILSQYFLKLILEPISEFKKLRFEISFFILSNQLTIRGQNGGDFREIKSEIWKLSAKLRATSSLIPHHDFLNKCNIFDLPGKTEILLACRKLNVIGSNLTDILLAEGETAEANGKLLRDVSRLLNIETHYSLDGLDL